MAWLIGKSDTLGSGSSLARILPWGVQILIFVIKFPKFVEISNLTRKKNLDLVQSNFGLGVQMAHCTPLATPMIWQPKFFYISPLLDRLIPVA